MGGVPWTHHHLSFHFFAWIHLQSLDRHRHQQQTQQKGNLQRWENLSVHVRQLNLQHDRMPDIHPHAHERVHRAPGRSTAPVSWSIWSCSTSRSTSFSTLARSWRLVPILSVLAISFERYCKTVDKPALRKIGDMSLKRFLILIISFSLVTCVCKIFEYSTTPQTNATIEYPFLNIIFQRSSFAFSAAYIVHYVLNDLIILCLNFFIDLLLLLTIRKGPQNQAAQSRRNDSCRLDWYQAWSNKQGREKNEPNADLYPDCLRFLPISWAHCLSSSHVHKPISRWTGLWLLLNVPLFDLHPSCKYHSVLVHALVYSESIFFISNSIDHFEKDSKSVLGDTGWNLKKIFRNELRL